MPQARLSRRAFNLSAAAAAVSVAAPSLAQSAWPSKPIRIVVPYTPGGFTDQMARLISPGCRAGSARPSSSTTSPAPTA